MAVKQAEVGELLECLPMDTVEYAFAYGSGALAQAGESTSGKMVDFVVATNDPLKFHGENLKLNPQHYSAIRHLGAGAICELQRNHGARVYYNTHVRYKDRLMKYGVISTKDLKRDLLDWRWLYLAGRLHKPVLNIVVPDEAMIEALKENRKSALQASLLLLPDTFSLRQFFVQLVSLSYNGDFRMFFGEDKNKITKIADGNAQQLEEIYLPMLEKDSRTLVRGSRIEQELSTPALYHRLQLLPSTVLERLQRASNQRDAKQRDIEEVTFSLAHHLDAPLQVSAALESIVAPAAWRQTAKNVITAGFLRSAVYSFAKIKKMFRSL